MAKDISLSRTPIPPAILKIEPGIVTLENNDGSDSGLLISVRKRLDFLAFECSFSTHGPDTHHQRLNSMLIFEEAQLLIY